jgi:hypothetical protein
MPLDFLAHIRAESARFVEVLRDCDPEKPVPPCPDRTAADLLWRLSEVQHFWGTIVRERLQAPRDNPPRPDAYADLLAEFQSSSDALAATLAETPDDVAVWTWSDDQTVGFIRRRQAHEVLIHRLDAVVHRHRLGSRSRRVPVEPAHADRSRGRGQRERLRGLRRDGRRRHPVVANQPGVAAVAARAAAGSAVSSSANTSSSIALLTNHASNALGGR